MATDSTSPVPDEPSHTLIQTSAPPARLMANGSPPSYPETLPKPGEPAESGTLIQSERPTILMAPGLPDVPGYVIEREIARGGMGMILAARDVSLGRDVAIKVLLPEHATLDAAQRFIVEAKITARLPHPAIPPVHQLGTLADGNPFLAMKLIRGRTLADELKATDRVKELPRFVQIFEQIAQSVGFAHSQGVIHRDLKPANVMVGAFGEVQVMDWGLAKDLAPELRDRREPAVLASGRREPAVLGADIPVTEQFAHADRSPAYTVAGAVMGTPAYMPPEQARGEVVDARADVFTLGGILCNILTGRPPFTGSTVRDTVRLAAEGDVTSAFSRLDECGADADMIALCKRCLSPKAKDRPTDGKAVADEVAAYRAAVDERLRKAETERAAAEARAAEEANTLREVEARIAEQRKRRRVQVALACAVGLMLLGGGAFAWWQSDQEKEARITKATFHKEQSDQKEEARIKQATFDTERKLKEEEGKLKAEHARERAVNLLEFAEDARKDYRYTAAENALEAAGKLAKEFNLDIAPNMKQSKDNLAFVRDLDAIRMKRSTWVTEADGKDHFDEANAPKEYRAAFLARGLDVVANPETVSARVVASAVRTDLVAALDDWAILEPDAVVRDKVLAVLWKADGKSAAAPFRDPTVWKDRAKLELLAAKADVARMSPGAVVAIAEVMRTQGLNAAPLLRHGVSLHPRDFLLAFSLAQAIPEKNNKDYESLGAYRAARAIRPDNIAVLTNLGDALLEAGDRPGAIAAFKEAIRLDSKYAQAHYNLGIALRRSGDIPGAITAYKEALRLNPKDAQTHCNLGIVLRDSGDLPGAIAAYKEAIRFDPKLTLAHTNLGNALHSSGDIPGAITAYKEAIRLDQKLTFVHYNLGIALHSSGDIPGAIAAYKEALRLDPKFAFAHCNLGIVLRGSGDGPGAIAAFKEAIRFDPKLTLAHCNLGIALHNSGDIPGAITAYKEAIRLDPKDATNYCSLGIVLRASGDIPGGRIAFAEAVRLDPKKYEPLFRQLFPPAIAPPPREVKP